MRWLENMRNKGTMRLLGFFFFLHLYINEFIKKNWNGVSSLCFSSCGQSEGLQGFGSRTKLLFLIITGIWIKTSFTKRKGLWGHAAAGTGKSCESWFRQVFLIWQKACLHTLRLITPPTPPNLWCSHTVSVAAGCAASCWLSPCAPGSWQKTWLHLLSSAVRRLPRV